MRAIELLWSAYDTAYKEYREEWHTQAYDESMSDTEFLYDFLDNYLVYNYDKLKIISDIISGSLIDDVFIEQAIRISEDVGLLAFILAKNYISKRIAQQEKKWQVV